MSLKLRVQMLIKEGIAHTQMLIKEGIGSVRCSLFHHMSASKCPCMEVLNLETTMRLSRAMRPVLFLILLSQPYDPRT